ncbi:M16 family metallopeptidase [Trichloromonas sp.]|uniref:M16 family metallopeptidase n=1 Tax=Trichloromonas sp. TaxID=3069249 RepID=UPI002A3B5607|nr:pitrilysin family protein [Trichloromonas sp.]
MMSFLRWLLPILLFLAGCTPQSPVRPDQLSFAPLKFEVPRIEPVTLANGIRLYLHEDHELPLVEISVTTGSGGIVDPPEKTGLADLLAVLLRTGGAGDFSPEAFDRELERMAADFTAAADTYTTQLALSLRRDDLRAGLEMLHDVLSRPKFDAGRLELARRQAIELVRRQDDDPGALASRELMRALYGEHPLGRSPSVAGLESIRREDLVARHRRDLAETPLWIGISGDFASAEVTRLMTEIFADRTGGAGSRAPVPPLVAAEAPALWLAEKEIPQSTILLGEVAIDKDNPDVPAVRVMNFILGGGGFNSRLMREVRSNRGLAYSVYSYYDIGRRLPGPFVAGCETRNGATAEVITLIRGIMTDLRETPVTDEELRIARESLINSFVFAFSDSHQVVNQQMRLDYYDYAPDYLQTYRDRIAAVTVADVQRVARLYLHPDRQQLVLVGNPAEFDAAPESLGLPVKKLERKTP